MTPSTLIAAASNGATLPQAVITVVDTTAFAPTGVLLLGSSLGLQTITYTGTTPTTFTGCTGGLGTLATGGLVCARTTIRQQLWMEAATAPGVVAGVAHGVASIYGSEPLDAVPVGVSPNVSAPLDAPWLELDLDTEARVPGSNIAVEIHARWSAHDDVMAGYTRIRPLLQQLAYLYTEEWLGDGLIDATGGEYWYWVGMPEISQETDDRPHQQVQQWITVPFRKTYSGGGP